HTAPALGNLDAPSLHDALPILKGAGLERDSGRGCQPHESWTGDVPRGRAGEPDLARARGEPHRVPRARRRIHPTSNPTGVVAERRQADLHVERVVAPG